MNDMTHTAPASDTGGEGSRTQAGDDVPSSSTTEAPRKRPGFLARLGGRLGMRPRSTLRDDLADALAEQPGGPAAFSPGERAMLNNILRLRELRVEDVMVPRAEIEAVELSTTLGDLLAHFERSGHSRMPVYGDTLDDPRGMVHIRDLVAHLVRAARQKRRSPRAKAGAATPAPASRLDLGNVDLAQPIGELNLVRSVLFVPPSMLASDLMARMQAAHIQMALVIDEYGGTDGLVSLEDVVEMVVGDIEDEHDEEEPMIRQTGDGVFVVDGRTEIDDVADVLGDAFETGEHAEDVDTIGGMIVNALGRVPARGEVVQALPGFELHVLDADPRRVKRVRIVQARAGDRRRRQPRVAETTQG